MPPNQWATPLPFRDAFVPSSRRKRHETWPAICPLWLAKHPRFVLHFAPTSSSWLNLVERFFGKLTDKAIRRGIFTSVPDLIAAIDAYLNANNDNPKPFQWTATADQILEKVRRGRVTLDTITT